MIQLRYFVLLAMLTLPGWGISQELPPIQNFTPADYSSESQNWAISQSTDKIIYVANNNGLLEFDGARWTLYPSPNESIIRAVKVVGNRIYTGNYMDFGYWEKDRFGILRYTSLAAQMNDALVEDEEFWGILNLGEFMVFQSHSRIYSYNLGNNSVSIINSDSFLPKIFKVGQTVYFQKMNHGLFRIENGQEVLVYDQEPLKSDEVISIVPDDRELLILTRNSGFYKSQANALEKWNVAIDSLLNDISLYSGLQMQEGSFALGTISHGLILMDKDGQLIRHIDQISGLQNNTVLSLYEDEDANVWLGLDVGISYINFGSPFQVYPDSRGLVGSVYASAVQDDYLYLGTNQGLFYKNGNQSDFQFVEGTHGQVWSLDVVDGTLFCGHHSGTYVISEGKAQKISNIQGTWKVGDLSGKPNFALQGNYDGLYVLEKTDGNWQLRNKVEGFDNSARYFEIFGDQIFVNHEYKGVFKVKVDEDFSHSTHVRIDTVIRGSNSGLIKYKGKLLYAFKNGIFSYEKQQDKFVKDTVLSQLYSPSEYTSGKMVVDPKNGYLWTFSNASIGYVSESSLASTLSISKVPLTENIRNGIIGYESATAIEKEGVYLFGARSGYFTLDVKNFQENPIDINIGTVQIGGKNRVTTEKNLWDPNITGDFESEENSLQISYYVPHYNKYLKPQYQYQLRDIYPTWSNWSSEASVLFENLPPGNYTFNVRAKIGEKVSESMESFTFKIARPWYLSNLMWMVYIVGAILGSILIHSLYRRYYNRRQQKLIEENKREMELAKAQNEKEIIKLKNKQLQEEFRSKSNELAASTMSIIKKNELLAKVKEQLAANADDKDTIKPIIHVIDKSLNRNDDWELFKEAFNNADRKFLKKLKKAHANLSPNDIRLCAYLRLNLSSKEIAPMFNISPRSVEIKRYRLRKKMNLEHDDNLVDYILKL
ncbi:triple tyrosine motif-containing protein [Flagellimonas algicola]|uniref:LuxR family transcriptional regulator n=1 Tax=Flagellimonas algicola TaxID=2583815 RepID=A0ABY2WQN1_9FLAO|nr:triple tyrosine motif-containing protein [Allomuricauda algicola]TMU57050.1 LuxR family transcriptional regulator [Allomuricauda algicola]